jgi:hypothetical protein
LQKPNDSRAIVSIQFTVIVPKSGLENRLQGNLYEGSNPSLSACILRYVSSFEPSFSSFRPLSTSASYSRLALFESLSVRSSDLGMSPTNDGKMIRLQVPPMSGDQRQKMVARIKKSAEDAKVACRNVRRDGNKHFDQAEKAKEMTEDDRDKGKEQVQSLLKRSRTKSPKWRIRDRKRSWNSKGRAYYYRRKLPCPSGLRTIYPTRTRTGKRPWPWQGSDRAFGLRRAIVLITSLIPQKPALG